MKWIADMMPDYAGKTVIVTGANSGIGYETARAFAYRNAEVILACRDEDRGASARAKLLEALPHAAVQVERLDLSDLASVRAFAARFLSTHTALDVLVNNAGVMIPPYTLTADGFELQLGTNHLGHFALTGLLIGAIAETEGSRVVTVSSLTHRMGKIDFEDLHFQRRPYRAWMAYAQSKLANLLFVHELVKRLTRAGAPVIAAASHPGYTGTNLQSNMWITRLSNPIIAMSAEQGALPSLYAASAPDVEAGEYFGPDGLLEYRGHPTRVGRSRSARNDATAERLWDVSVEATGVRYEALG